jgi:hypothetical protein
MPGAKGETQQQIDLRSMQAFTCLQSCSQQLTKGLTSVRTAQATVASEMNPCSRRSRPRRTNVLTSHGAERLTISPTKESARRLVCLVDACREDRATPGEVPRAPP